MTRTEKLPDLAARLRSGGLDILAIGSSSTEGVGASSPARSYPAQLEDDLRTRLRANTVRVRNAGIGGETATATIGRLENALAQGDHDLVLWQVGTNDAVTGADEGAFRELLRRGITAARAAGVPLILIDQQYYPTIRDPARYERYVGIVGEIAAEAGVPVFTRYAIMRAWAERSPEALARMLSADGFHMGDLGYDCVAQLLADTLTAPALVASVGGVRRDGAAAQPPRTATTVAAAVPAGL